MNASRPNEFTDQKSGLPIQNIVVILLILQVLLSGAMLFRILKLQESITALQSGSAEVDNEHYENVSVGSYPRLGNENAEVTIVAFSDFQCPYCASGVDVVNDLIEAYPTQIQFYFRDFPLEPMHPEAMNAAMAARCANDQGRFWDYYEQLFENQSSLSTEFTYDLADDLGLNTREFSTCVETEKFSADILQDISEGQALDVSGTPAFFINGYLVRGADKARMVGIIEAELQR